MYFGAPDRRSTPLFITKKHLLGLRMGRAFSANHLNFLKCCGEVLTLSIHRKAAILQHSPYSSQDYVPIGGIRLVNVEIPQ